MKAEKRFELWIIFFIILLMGFIAIKTYRDITNVPEYDEVMLYDAPEIDSIASVKIDSSILEALDSLAEYSPRKIKYIVVHCTAVPPNVTLTVKKLLDIFRERWGPTRPGYHFFIDKSGVLHSLWNIDMDSYLEYGEIVWGARGYNDVSIHVSYDGGLDGRMNPFDSRSELQRVSLDNFIQVAKMVWPDAVVIGHRDISSKACPSFDAKAEYSE